jgi:hypothetical protein
LIAAHQFGASALALDDTRVYWSTAEWVFDRPELANEIKVVRSCAKADCAGTVVTYATQQETTQVTVSATHVFWGAGPDRYQTSNDFNIYACPISGCVGPPRVVAKSFHATGFAIDETSVYWIGDDATVLKCPVEGCQGAPTLVGLLNYGPPSAALFPPLVVDATHVYLITGKESPPVSGTIVAIPKDGSAPARTIAEGRPFPAWLTVDATNIYWTERHMAGSVRSCPLAGCTGEPTLLASDQPYPGSLAVDAERVYWINFRSAVYPPNAGSTSGELLACPLSGCGSNPTVLAANQPEPRTIAIDGTHVYWTTFGEVIDNLLPDEIRYDGMVQRIRKR